MTLGLAPLRPGSEFPAQAMPPIQRNFTGSVEAAESIGAGISVLAIGGGEPAPGGFADAGRAVRAMEADPRVDLLLWGEVLGSRESPEIHLRITAREERGSNTTGAARPGIRLGFERTLRLDPVPPSRLPELPQLLRGLAAIQDREWEEALEVFEVLEAPPLRAALASVLFTPERMGEFDSKLLSRATQSVGRAFNSASTDSKPETENTLRLAYAHATYVLGERLRGQACVQPLESAGLNFALYLQALPRDAPREARSAGYRGLGDSLLRLGQRGEGSVSVQYLSRAVRVYNRALGRNSNESESAALARIRFHRGLALYELGNRLPGPEGLRSLEQSAEEFHSLLGVYTKEAAPLSWASCQANLGQAEFAMGQKSAPSEAIQHYVYATTAYGQALEIYTLEAMPEAWARTHENLGLSFSALGAAMNGPEAIEHLLRGVEHLNRVDEVANLDEDPELWAMTRIYLAKAQLSLGEKLHPDRAEEAFIQALRHCEAALGFFTREGHGRAWAVAQQSLGVASMRISEFSDERKARDRLNEAVGAFGAALEIRSLEATPEDWGISQWNLANALILRSRLEEGEIAASDLRSAAEACREALKAFPRDGKPGDHARVQLTLAQSLGELAEVAPDETEAARAADQAVWILVRTLGQLEVSETGDLRASLRRELDHIQRVRGILRAG